MDLDQLRMIGKVFYYGISVAAVLRGDRPLRLVGAAIVAGSVLTPLTQRWDALQLPQYGVMVADLALLCFMGAVLLRDRRWWLVVASGCFLMSLLTHFAGLMGAPISPYATATARLLWCYAMVLAVGGGLVAYELGRKRRGAADVVRALVAEQGEARTRLELDRRYLVANSPAERAEASRLVETFHELTASGEQSRGR